MAKTQSPSYPHGSSASRGKLIVVMIVAALVVVLALLSAFVWPGWALNKTDEVTKVQQQTATEPTKPSIKATALPDDASELLKAMPDSVLNYARTKAGASETWKSASPLEEYTLTYSTGKSAKDVTVIVAQWSDSDTVKKQYDELAKNLTGKELSGKSTDHTGSCGRNHNQLVCVKFAGHAHTDSGTGHGSSHFSDHID